MSTDRKCVYEPLPSRRLGRSLGGEPTLHSGIGVLIKEIKRRTTTKQLD